MQKGDIWAVSREDTGHRRVGERDEVDNLPQAVVLCGQNFGSIKS